MPGGRTSRYRARSSPSSAASTAVSDNVLVESSPGSGAPQDEQNRASRGFSWPQRGQITPCRVSTLPETDNESSTSAGGRGSSRFGEFPVAGRVEETVVLRGVAELELEDLAVAVRVLVDEF